MKKAPRVAGFRPGKEEAGNAWKHESWLRDPETTGSIYSDLRSLLASPARSDPSVTRSQKTPEPGDDAQLSVLQTPGRSTIPTEDERRALLERAHDVLNRLIAKYGKSIRTRGLSRGAYAALVDATTDKWLAEGRLRDYPEKRAVMQYVLNLPRYDPRAPVAPAERQEYAMYALEPQEMSLAYARTMGAALVPRLSDETRAAMRQIVAEWAASGKPLHRLESLLRGSFATLNRDWLLVAQTEASLIRVHGKLAALIPGRQVTWSAAIDCCERCKRWEGSTFTVVTPGHPNKEPYAMMWPGKIALHQRDEDFADDRGAPPAIPMHEGCRCIYRVHLPEIVPTSSLSPQIRELIEDLRRRALEP